MCFTKWRISHSHGGTPHFHPLIGDVPQHPSFGGQPVETPGGDARDVALQDDFEKRIVGWWEYPGSTFEIRLEPWGALVFQEDTVKIELMKKGKLRWRGEVELISGMVLNLSFEPGSDVLVLEFIPPSDAQLNLNVLEVLLLLLFFDPD